MTVVSWNGGLSTVVTNTRIGFYFELFGDYDVTNRSIFAFTAQLVHYVHHCTII